MICHRTLLEKLSRTSLPPSLTRWLSGYLTGRQARTLFRGETSPARIVRTGVPQGSVISLTLFNSYVGSLPSPPEGVNLVSYADDVTPWASGPKISIITAKLQSYLDSLTSYFQSLKLGLSPGKCAVTLLTPDTKECNVQPHLTVADIPLKLEKHPKVLGVRFDPMFKFGEPCRVAASNASRAVDAMKAFAGTDWGQDTETQLVTFKALVRPRRDAGAPGESPHGNACNTTSLGLPPPRTPWSETPRETSSPPQNETRTSLCPCPPSGTPPRRRWPAATNEGVPTAPENCAHRDGGDDNAVVSTVWSPRYKTPSCQRPRGEDPTQTYSEDPQPTSVRLQSTPVVVPGQARTRSKVLLSPLPYSPPHDCPPVPRPHKPH